MPLTRGTAYFPTIAAATAYYRPYGHSPSDVAAKLAAGEIFVGKPYLGHGERAELIDGGLRWAIVEPAYRDKMSEGLKSLTAEYRIQGSGDAWGSCMGWLFSVADYMADQEIDVPDDWGYRQAMAGPDRTTPEFEALADLAPSEADLLTFGGMLWRLRAIIKAAGRDY